MVLFCLFIYFYFYFIRELFEICIFFELLSRNEQVKFSKLVKITWNFYTNRKYKMQLPFKFQWILITYEKNKELWHFKILNNYKFYNLKLLQLLLELLFHKSLNFKFIDSKHSYTFSIWTFSKSVHNLNN